MMTTLLDIPKEELPLWMRQARQGIDWGFIMILALSLAVGWAFLLHQDLPRTQMGKNYAFQAADIANSLREGRLYPRWSPHALSGYGAPIPHYYPPGAPYAAALIEILLTNDTVTAIRILNLFALGLAGITVYGFVTRHIHAAAGVVSALLYVFSPYLGASAPYILGDLNGVLSLALMPMLLWGISRLLMINAPFDFALVSLTTAALILTDPRHAIIGWIVVLPVMIWRQWAQQNLHLVRRVLVAGALGLGIASFYWLPAWLEYAFVDWQEPILPAAPFKLEMSQIFSVMRQIDPGTLVSLPPLTIGLSLVIFSLLGLVVLIFVRRQFAFHSIFLSMGVFLLGLGLFYLQTQTWLLGPITLCLSIGASACLRIRDFLPERLSRLFLAMSVIVILVIAIPVWIGPNRVPDEGPLTPQAQIEYEQQGLGVATLPPGALIPRTIAESLQPNRFILDGYRSGDVNRFAPNQSAFRVRSVTTPESHRLKFQVQVLERGKLDILQAYFPGWIGYINNQEANLTPNPATGLIQVAANTVYPTGATLDIELATTPSRSRAWTISWTTFALMIVLTWGRLRRYTYRYDTVQLLNREDIRLLTTVLILFVLAGIAVNLPASPISLRAASRYALRDTVVLNIPTDVGLEVISYQLNKTTFVPGEELDISIYWQAVSSLRRNYQVRVYLQQVERDDEWFPTPPQHPGYYPTRRWLRNYYVRDMHTIQISSSAIAGEYQIIVEANACDLDCSIDRRLNFFDTDARLIGPKLTLPVVVTISG